MKGQVVSLPFFTTVQFERYIIIMRTVFIAAALAASATVAGAVDLGTTGVTLNTDVVATHMVDAETTTMTIEPELGYAFGMANFTMGTMLNIWDNDNKVTLDNEFDHLPVIDFGVTYGLTDSVELEATTSYDLEAETRGEIKLMTTFSF